MTCGCSTSCNDDYECNYCVVGCQCKRGYLVDEVGECVPEDLCSRNQIGMAYCRCSFFEPLRSRILRDSFFFFSDLHSCDGVIDPCYENGYCLKEGNSYRCICFQNYWGQNCEMSKFPTYLSHIFVNQMIKCQKYSFTCPLLLSILHKDRF